MTKKNTVFHIESIADDKCFIKFVFPRVENIMGRGENACYQQYLLFTQYFQKAFSSALSEVLIPNDKF